jgi:predicted DNA-binding transcriptional regulator AlpA
MTDHTFTLRFLAAGRTLDDLSVQLYERIDDVSLMGPDNDGSFLLEFDRRASSLPDAFVKSLGELTDAVPEVTVLRVEEDDLATMVDIAKRTGRTPESIRLLVNARRGPGGFPPAAGHLGGRMKAWRWADVAQWFEQALGQPLPDMVDSAFVQAFNDALEIRRLADRLGTAQRRAIAKVLPEEFAVA